MLRIEIEKFYQFLFLIPSENVTFCNIIFLADKQESEVKIMELNDKEKKRNVKEKLLIYINKKGKWRV